MIRVTKNRIAIGVSGEYSTDEFAALIDEMKAALELARMYPAAFCEPVPQTIRSHGAGGHVVDEPRPEPFIARDSHGNAIDQILRGAK